MTIAKGDMVLVIGIDEDAPEQWPRPGAIGQVEHICYCALACGYAGFKCYFSGDRHGCYRPPQLRKIEPPGADEFNRTDTPQETTT